MAMALSGQTPALCLELALKTGIPLSELQLGLWPAVEQFLEWNPQWELVVRRANNNGLTVLRRKVPDAAATAAVGVTSGAHKVARGTTITSGVGTTVPLSGI